LIPGDVPGEDVAFACLASLLAGCRAARAAPGEGTELDGQALARESLDVLLAVGFEP